MENNSANGKYVQRYLPPETLQEIFTCCSYIVYNTSLSLYNSVSCCMCYMQDNSSPYATLPATGDWLRICECVMVGREASSAAGIMNVSIRYIK